MRLDQMKMSRSLKLMRVASIRTSKLARDMLVFWKRVDKEMMGLGKTIQAMAFLAHLAEVSVSAAMNELHPCALASELVKGLHCF
ncbi:hypothetical protein L2E82_32549 [Cichorium intybus]|uniref:Uncharacterized protein n=1 Tax=Cichorium intybus TaxID=13427 RepID=A0ACB9BIM8_CICIN|nr:hypothetical protein L2E82_32549 [Cichorium intybus]